MINKYLVLIITIGIIGAGLILFADPIGEEIDSYQDSEIVTAVNIKFNDMNLNEKQIIRNDTLLFETPDKKHWLRMESSIDSKELSETDEIEVTKKKDNWKFDYKFNANNDDNYKVTLFSDEEFIIGNWSVWTNTIEYNFMDAIEAGYVVEVQVDGNSVVVSYDIKGRSGIVSIDPFVTILGASKKQGNSVVVLNNELYVFWSNMSDQECNYYNLSGQRETDCNGYVDGGSLDVTFAFNFSADYHRIVLGEAGLGESHYIYNVSADGTLADKVVISNTGHQLTTDAIVWDGDLWLLTGQLNNITVRQESNDYAAVLPFLDLEDTDSNVGFFVNNINTDNNLSVFAGSLSDTLWEATMESGGSWENVTVAVENIGLGMDAVSFEGSKYVFWNNGTTPTSLGNALRWTKNTTTGYQTPQTLFNPISLPNETVRSVWAVNRTNGIFVFFLVVDDLGGGKDNLNMSFYAINMTAGDTWGDARIIDKTLWNYAGTADQLTNYGNAILDNVFYTTSVMNAVGEEQWRIYLWNATMGVLTAPTPIDVNITISKPLGVGHGNVPIISQPFLLEFTLFSNGTEYESSYVIDSRPSVEIGLINDNVAEQRIINKFDDGIHTITVTAENYGINNTNSTTFTVDYFNFDNTTSVTSGVESNTSHYTINITNSSFVNDIDVVFVFNGTAFTPELTRVGDITQFNASVINPMSPNNTNYEFYWNLSFDFTNGTSGWDTNTTAQNLSVTFGYLLETNNLTTSPASIVELDDFTAFGNLTRLLNVSGITYLTTFTTGSDSQVGTEGQSTSAWRSESGQLTSSQITNGSLVVPTFVNVTYRITAADSSFREIIAGATVDVQKIAVLETGGTRGTLTLNFTLYDEETGLVIADGSDSSFELWITSLNRPGNSFARNFSFTNSSFVSYTFNMFPNTTWLDMTATIVYSKTGFSTRTSNLNNINITNTTQLIKLWLANDTVIGEMTFVLQDSVLQKVPGKFIHVDKIEAGTGSYNTIAILETDVNGRGVTELEKGSGVSYRLRVFDSDGITLLLTSEPVVFQTTDLEHPIVLSGGTSFFSESSIAHQCAYSDSSKILSCNITDHSGEVSRFRFLVRHRDKSRFIFVDDQQNTTTATTGVQQQFAFTVTDETFDYSYFVYYERNSDSLFRLIDSGNIIIPRAVPGYGTMGLMILLMIFCVLVFLGMQNPVIPIIGGIFTIIFGQFIGLINLPEAAVISLVFVGIVIIYVMATRR